MSIQAMSWVLAHSRSEGSDRLVLLAIANHADAAGLNAFPRVDVIAEEAKVSRATVFRAIRSLEILGELERRAGVGRGRPNSYRVLMERVSSGSLKGLTVRQKGSQSEIKGSQSCDTEPSVTVNEPSRAREAEAPLASGLVDLIRQERGWVKPEEETEEPAEEETA